MIKSLKVYKYNNIKSKNEIDKIDTSKINKIVKPLDNNSFQDSFYNISGVYYFSLLFDKNTIVIIIILIHQR